MSAVATIGVEVGNYERSECRGDGRCTMVYDGVRWRTMEMLCGRGSLGGVDTSEQEALCT